MTICLKTSSAGSASEGFSDIHAETARMSGITNRVLRPVPDAEARKPIRGRHNLRYAIEKPWVEPGAFLLPVVGMGQISRYRWFSIALARQKLHPLVCRCIRERHFSGKKQQKYLSGTSGSERQITSQMY